MKMISIDVGIKNLACVILDFDKEYTPSKIIKWDVLDLTERPKCCNTLCNEIALYDDHNGSYLCRKHAKNHHCGLQLPKPSDKVKNIQKMKINELKEYAYTKCIKLDSKMRKNDILKLITDKLKTIFFSPITHSKADEYDLITLGRCLDKKLNKFMDDLIDKLDYVCIENQISPLANRMKTLQGMITQYFIIKSPDTKIQFISAMNKLKELDMESSTYSERKKEGIILCRNKINEYNYNWSSFFETSKKKDDLSDCYLQGLYCIKKIRQEM